MGEANRMISEAKDPTPSEIQPRLFLGNSLCSQDLSVLRKKKITHILNATSSLPNQFEDAVDGNGKTMFQYLRIPVEDDESESILDHLHESVAFIDQALCNHGRVLVHCQQGVSRSATIVVAYLMGTYQWRPSEALQHVKQK